MSKARSKGTAGENYFMEYLKVLFPTIERAPLKGTQDKGDYVNVPWLHESKSTIKPLFQAWARTASKKASDWVILWKGDLRSPANGNGPYVLMPLHLYLLLVSSIEEHVDEVQASCDAINRANHGGI